MKRFLVTLSLLTVLLLSLEACGGSTPTPSPSEPVSIPELSIQETYNIEATPEESSTTAVIDDSKYGGTVKIIDTGDFNEPMGLPWQAIAGRAFNCCFAENLANIKFGGIYEPWLAENWDIDMEKQTITFYLKKGVQFTDGSPFNAEVVKWLYSVAEEDGKGNEDMRSKDMVVIDDHTLEVHFNNWQNVLFETFCMKTYAMVSMENYLKNGKEYARQNPIGSGPFKVKEFNRGTNIVFERNPDYWMEGIPFLDTVEYIGITDVMVQNATLMTTNADSVDFFQTTNAEQVWTLINADIDFDYTHMRSTGSFVLGPNSVDEVNNPFFDQRIRTATSHAIDRDALCEAKGFGIWQPSAQLTGPGFAGNLKEGNPYLEQAIYDPELARTMLAEAGYPNGFSTVIHANTQFQDQLVVIQEMLRNVGIICELDFVDAGRITELHHNGWEGMMAFNWGQVTNTGVSYFMYYHPDVTTYVSSVRPPEYEDMYYAARRSYTIEDKLFGDLGELILKHQVFIPIYHTFSTYFIRNGLLDAGFKEYGTGMWSPWLAYWSR